LVARQFLNGQVVTFDISVIFLIGE
jgi:hypothetical protein